MGKAGSPEEGQEGAVFQYRALAPELVFDGVILISAGVKDSEEILKSVLNTGPFWMGGSISAGYGKVEIRMKPSEGWREIPGNLHDIKSGDAFTAIFLSDALVRDDNGQLGDNVVEALNSCLGDKSVGLESGYQRLHWVGGFNRTWGLPLPQEWVVQAGSSYNFIAKRKLSAEELRSLEIEGLGERRSEGFGRVAFNWDFPSKLQTKDVASVQASSESTEMLAEEEQELADKMVDRWLQQRLDREVAAAINRTMSTVKGLDRISNSQLGRLRLQCREAARQRDMTPLKTYIRQVQVRSVARDQLQRVTVNGHNLLAWIGAWANTDNNINSLFYIWDALNVKDLETYQIGAGSGGISWQADSSLTHEYTVRLVDGLLARLMRQRSTES
jgi:CRISPR-associated protein Csx10